MRTTDAFLNAHLIDSYLFYIGGRLWPISIRDQMLRGQLIVDRAIEQGLIHIASPLAIVGAGAAGVTAALRAADRGVPVTLFERDRLFSRHAQCQTRMVHPTQYDWLVGHWDAGAFPWPGTPGMPLEWPRPHWASSLAREWEIQFIRQYPRLQGLLTMRLPADVIVPPTPPAAAFNAAGNRNPILVDWTDLQTGQVRQDPFGIVVLAMGFGEEKTYLAPPSPYRGFEFWATDPFSLPNLGCPNNPPRVLISGGGDGALQDFLRVTTRCETAVELWKNLPATALAAVADLRDAEDQALRAFAWGPGYDSHFDHATLERLHREHDRVATALLAYPRVEAALQRLIRTDFHSVTLVHSCTHLSQGYGLNHVLVLLVAKYLQATNPACRHIFTSGMALSAIQCLHPPPISPADCNGKPHNVDVRPQPTCARPANPNNLPPGNLLGTFDVLILRHGIEPTPLRANKGNGAALPPLRQLLPYHLPS